MSPSWPTLGTWKAVRGGAKTESPNPGEVPSRSPISVLVVEGHEVTRRGIESILRTIDSVEFVAATSTLIEGLAVLEAHPVDVLMLASDEADIETVETSIDRSNGLSIIVLLRDERPEQLQAALRVSADGFVLESDICRENLESSLRQIAEGRIPIPTSIARQLLARSRSDGNGGGYGRGLTAREHQVLILLARGLTNKEIARELAISHYGVKRHVANVLAKLNSPNRTFAVARALTEGLMSGHGSRVSTPQNSLGSNREAVLLGQNE